VDVVGTNSGWVFGVDESGARGRAKDAPEELGLSLGLDAGRSPGDAAEAGSWIGELWADARAGSGTEALSAGVAPMPRTVDESGTKKRGRCAPKLGAGVGAVEASSGRTTWFFVRGNSS
jgi:hypothetical protein